MRMNIGDIIATKLLYRLETNNYFQSMVNWFWLSPLCIHFTVWLLIRIHASHKMSFSRIKSRSLSWWVVAYPMETSGTSHLNKVQIRTSTLETDGKLLGKQISTFTCRVLYPKCGGGWHSSCKTEIDSLAPKNGPCMSVAFPQVSMGCVKNKSPAIPRSRLRPHTAPHDRSG